MREELVCIDELLLFFRRLVGIRKNDVFEDEDHTLDASLVSLETDFLPVALLNMSAIPDTDDLEATEMGLSTWKFESGRDEAGQDNKLEEFWTVLRTHSRRSGVVPAFRGLGCGAVIGTTGFSVGTAVLLENLSKRF
jgi:hypothetical protein